MEILPLRAQLRAYTGFPFTIAKQHTTNSAAKIALPRQLCKYGNPQYEFVPDRAIKILPVRDKSAIRKML